MDSDNHREQRGIIFDIQRYSIHDGPGIRTTVFFKGCPLRCFWCQNPESQKRHPEIFLNRGKCTLCGRCVSVCPVGANSLAGGHSAIDRRKCEGCGECVESCPNGARTLTGRDVTVDEVVQEVLRDKKFYDNSGGGVTLSGGDPLNQPEFALSILKACKKADIHTALETCGYTPWPSMEKLLEYIDLVLYDIKCIEPGKHRKATGKSNARILENAKRLARSKSIKVRVPLIPDFNDSPEDIKAIVNFVNKEMGHVETELLPYNKLGESKYERLDRSIVELQAKDEGHRESLEKLTKIYPV